MNYHSRHDYIRKTGQRISKGGWERLNRAYDVYDTGRYHVIGLSDSGQPLVSKSVTHVLMPETTKANRKVSLRDKYNPKSKRERFNSSKPIAQTR